MGYSDQMLNHKDYDDEWGDREWAPTAPADIAQEDIEFAQGLDEDDIEEMLFDGGVETADGCWVEPDGRCPHGHRSPLLVLGLI